MDISELLADAAEYVCETCLHDFARSDHLRVHQRRSCRGIPSQPCQLCEVCWQWVKGNRHHLERHQRGSRCRPLDDRIAHRNQVADARRQRDAARHRQRRQQRRSDQAINDATDDSTNLPARSLATNDGDGEESCGVGETRRNQLDDLLCSSDGEQGGSDGHDGVSDDTPTPVLLEDVQELLQTADFDWNEIDLEAPPHDMQEGQVQSESEVQDGQDQVDDAADDVQWRGGVTDCIICLSSLDGKIWVCERETCRQPYHRECVKGQIAIDPRCSNCRAHIQLDVEDDEVLVVGHVEAPPTCLVCMDIITGTALEGPQCSHNFDFDCLVQYNAQFLGNHRSRNLHCPTCNQPFPIPSEFVSDESDEDAQAQYGDDDDNAFEYSEDQESSHDDTTGGMTNDGNSADEYHRSDFDSASDSDEDYNPGDEA